MAELQERNYHKSNQTEMTIEIRQTESKKNYTFILHGNHIEVRGYGQQISGPEWFDDLTDEEKLLVFNRILAEYRPRSMGEDGFKLASLGVTDKGRIYISENTEQLSDPYNRQCAEQNMVTISSQREVYQQKKELIAAGVDTSATEFVAKYPTYKAVYLMGGRENADPQVRVPIACPCGYCTDLLAKVMEPDAPVWILPVNDGKKPLTINTTAEMAKDLKPDEAWRVPINYLNKEREINNLPSDEADLQRIGMKSLARELSRELMSWKKKASVHSFKMDTDTKAIKFMKQAINGLPTLEVNKLQFSLIKRTLFNRLKEIVVNEGLGADDLNPENIELLMAKHVRSIRCAILELDNGKIATAVQSLTSVDKSSPSAEEIAKGMLNDDLGTQGIRRARIMEFNPSDIGMGEAGEPGMMHTSRKGAIERLVKGRSKVTNTVEFGFTPFNDTNITRDRVAQIMKIRLAEQMFPGFFTGKGSQQMEALQAEVRAKTELAGQQDSVQL